jgi:hypothetical protein
MMRAKQIALTDTVAPKGVAVVVVVRVADAFAPCGID